MCHPTLFSLGLALHESTQETGVGSIRKLHTTTRCSLQDLHATFCFPNSVTHKVYASQDQGAGLTWLAGAYIAQPSSSEESPTLMDVISHAVRHYVHLTAEGQHRDNGLLRAVSARMGTADRTKMRAETSKRRGSFARNIIIIKTLFCRPLHQ